MNKAKFLLIFLVLFPTLCFAQIKGAKETKTQFNVANDLKESFVYMFKGSYLQFLQPSSMALFAVGALTLWPVFNADTKIRNRQTPANKFTHKVGHEFANIFNFPVVPIISYTIARYINDQRLKRFAQETFASTYLALFESSVISNIHVHDRPDSSNLTRFETSFRGDSSFPSGHVVGLSVLTFKTFQFYGPLPALVPAFFTYITHKERISSRKHWASDTIGSIFMTAIACEGVRAASNYGENHPLYKMIYEHKLRLSFNTMDDGWIGRIAFNY